MEFLITMFILSIISFGFIILIEKGYIFYLERKKYNKLILDHKIYSKIKELENFEQEMVNWHNNHKR